MSDLGKDTSSSFWIGATLERILCSTVVGSEERATFSKLQQWHYENLQ
jgi:hypothetical protein